MRTRLHLSQEFIGMNSGLIYISERHPIIDTHAYNEGDQLYTVVFQDTRHSEAIIDVVRFIHDVTVEMSHALIDAIARVHVTEWVK